MKSIVKPKEDTNLPFPKLMKARKDDEIVLFYEQGKGTTVRNPYTDFDRVGQYSTNWRMSAFEDFTGTLELKN